MFVYTNYSWNGDSRSCCLLEHWQGCTSCEIGRWISLRWWSNEQLACHWSGICLRLCVILFVLNCVYYSSLLNCVIIANVYVLVLRGRKLELLLRDLAEGKSWAIQILEVLSYVSIILVIFFYLCISFSRISIRLICIYICSCRFSLIDHISKFLNAMFFVLAIATVMVPHCKINYMEFSSL